MVDWSYSLGITTRVKRLIGRPQEALLCAKAKRQRQMFSVAKAKRKQSDSYKALSRNGNQPLVLKKGYNF